MSSLLTPTGMLCFPNLFTPKAPAPKADPRYSLNLVFTTAAQKTPEYQALRLGVAQAIDGKWGAGKSADRAFVARLRLPFRPCDDKEYAGFDVPGGVFISAWSKDKPGVVDPRVQEIHLASDVWAGQLARARIHPFAYEQSGNIGVSFNLNNVQLVKMDMPRLDGRRKATDEFASIEGGDEYEDNGAPPANPATPARPARASESPVF